MEHNFETEEGRVAALACHCGGTCTTYRERIGFGIEAVPVPVPLEYAEDSILVHLSFPICIDPEGLPPVGSRERHEILAEHVIALLDAMQLDSVILADYIDGDELIERRDLRVTAPPPGA